VQVDFADRLSCFLLLPTDLCFFASPARTVPLGLIQLKKSQKKSTKPLYYKGISHFCPTSFQSPKIGLNGAEKVILGNRWQLTPICCATLDSIQRYDGCRRY
jgi:hypothetical protein